MLSPTLAFLALATLSTFSNGGGQTFGSLTGTVVDPLGAVLPRRARCARSASAPGPL